LAEYCDIVLFAVRFSVAQALLPVPMQQHGKIVLLGAPRDIVLLAVAFRAAGLRPAFLIFPSHLFRCLLSLRAQCPTNAANAANASSYRKAQHVVSCGTGPPAGEAGKIACAT
jgi:hypothetical protein